MDLCLAAERCTWSWVSKRWWEQEGLDTKGMCKVSWEAECEEGEEKTDKMTTDMDD